MATTKGRGKVKVKEEQGGEGGRPKRRRSRGEGGEGGGGAAAAPRRSWLGRLARWTVTLVLVGALGGAGGLAGIFWYYGQELPSILKREDFKPAQMTRIYSSEGHVIDELVADEGRRTVVAFEAISPNMRAAILAAEDADFYQHQGLDYMGMVRALYYAVRYNRRQGASTITQQVVKNLVLTPERTLKRKVQEILLSRELEQNLSKDDILYIYLNQIYFGHGNYGVQEASRYFFGKDARDLSLGEAAALAGMVQSPERYSPIKHPERTKARQTYVLKQMLDKGMITEAEHGAAVQASLKVVKERREVDPWLHRAPWYSAHVRRLLEQRFPEQPVSGMGLRVHTALVVEKQEAADVAVRRGVEAWDAKQGAGGPLRHLKPAEVEAHHKKERRRTREGLSPGATYEGVVLEASKAGLRVQVGDARGLLGPAPRLTPGGESLGARFKPGDVVSVMVERAWPADGQEVGFVAAPGVQAALVSIDVPTRRVEALVGGFDYAESSYNRATQARRQVGSAFKPVIYSAALADRLTTPATLWLDAPKPFQIPGAKPWNPKNADGKYLGPLRLRRALALSRNVVAVRLLEKVGLPRAQEYARQLGIEGELVDNFTFALGSSELTVLDMANAYTTLAGMGVREAPVFITRIEDSWGLELFQAQSHPEQVIPPEIAWLTVDMMTSVLTEGTASKVGRRLKRPAAGKTGTTNSARDAWFIGFTPQKVTAVWVGHDDNTPLGRGASGGTTAAPIWLDYMEAALKGLPKAEFSRPALGLVEARVDKATGLLAPEGRKESYVEHFLTGTAPTEYAPEEGESSAGDFLLNQGADDIAEAEAEE